jgi:sn-glycerol 3-phosphate transport system permease protein
MGIKQMVPTGDQTVRMAGDHGDGDLAMLPPVLVVVGMQKLFVKGLVESEK